MFSAEPCLVRFQARSNFLFKTKQKKRKKKILLSNHFKNEFNACEKTKFTALGTELC